MSIFFVTENPYSLPNNPYLRTLIDELKCLDESLEIQWGMRIFWSDEIFLFDIIHFQWPDACLTEGGQHHVEELENRLSVLKAEGKKIVATCHNLVPHYCQSEERIKCYSVVYRSCDYMFHLGEYSQEMCQKEYPQAEHWLLPHHVYDTIYPSVPSKEESCQRLGLKANKKHVLCFGAFRDFEERNIVSRLVKRWNGSIRMIAPNYMTVPQTTFPNKQRIRQLYYKYRYRLYVTGNTCHAVSEELLPYFFGASDMVLIPRVKILNSGNLPLAFLMKKAVVGPDVGNVGLLLRKTNNHVFDTGHLEELADIISSDEGYLERGLKNYEYAMSHWTTAMIGRTLLEYYKKLCKV
ncbi:MAG: hypothetical protein IJR02_05510 [Bacteroidaceae bacterium]|nr:hypothetical protein [Bacteroidaceae bacterium]